MSHEQIPGFFESHPENARCVIHVSVTANEATFSGDSPFLYLDTLSEGQYIIVTARLNLKKVRTPARDPKMSRDPFIQGAGKIPKSACAVHSMPRRALVKSMKFL